MNGQNIPPPPPGFQLQSQAGPPPPPPGFVLDSAPSRAQPVNTGAPAQETDGFWQELGDAVASGAHDLGNAAVLTGRNLLHGALSIPSMVNDYVVAPPVDYIAKKVGSDYRVPSGDAQIDHILNKAGVPDVRPTDKLARVISDADRGIGSALGGLGLGKTLATAGNEVVNGLGTLFASQPVGQAVSAAAGGSAASAAREEGYSPTSQAIIGVLAGLAPGSATTGVRAALRGFFRGGETGRQNMVQNIKAFEKAGTSPSAGQATQNRGVQAAESMLSRTPGGSGVMTRAAEHQATEASEGINKVASRLSRVNDPAGAGRVIERGITGKNGFTKRFEEKSRELYDKLDNFIPQDKRIDVSNVMRVLPELNPIIPGAPNTSRFFQNARIRGMEDALRSDAEGANAALTRPEVQQRADTLRASLERNNEAINASNRAGQEAIDQANSVRAGTPRQAFTPDQPLSSSEIESTIMEMAGSAADGKLPYQAVKKLRTLVGMELNNNSLVSDVPRSKWSALYAALSEDLGQAAGASGPQAKQAWNRANTFYKAGRDRLENLARVVDKAGGPEAVFNAAISGTRDGDSTIHAVMQSLKPDEQKALASVIVRRLGRATPGQQNAEGDLFSMGTFLTNWNRLSLQARKTLFGRFGPQFAKDMDDISRMAANVRAGSKVFSNPSGTAASAANIGTWMAFMSSLATGHFMASAGIGAGLAATNLVARLMTNRNFVHWLANQTRNGIPPQTANLANLYNMAKTHKEPELGEMADAIKKARQSDSM